MNINGKKLLFIGTGLYDYDEDLISGFKKRGAIISYFSSNYASRLKRILDILGLHSLGRKIMAPRISRLIDAMPSDIDYIFIIKGLYFRKTHIEQLKNKYPSCPTVLYQWDSVKNLNNWDLLHSSFSTILTFDREDALAYGLKFRPLYYRERNNNRKIKIDYDLSFVGISSPYRERIVKRIKNELDKANVVYKIIIVKSKLRFFVERYLSHRISKYDSNLYLTRPFSYKEYSDIVMSSNVILDIPDERQSGLTMRTIESIGFEKKLLTTNKDVINYGFNVDCYRLLDLTAYSLDIDFLKERKTAYYNSDNFTRDAFLDDIISSFDS